MGSKKQKILGTGLSGLVGSRIVELLSDSVEFQNISTRTGVDITNKSQVHEAIKNSQSSLVIHLAAKADVDSCEKDKVLGKNGDAWKINVEGTQHVADACLQYKKKLVYISTDFVFDGTREFYTEKDLPNPVNWYSETKYTGEKIVQNQGIPFLIVRLAYPYRGVYEKKDFFRAILSNFEKNKTVSAITDHIFCPTFVDDFALALGRLLTDNAEGIYHTVGGEALSPYDAASQIADIFGYSKKLIEPTTRGQYFKNRAIRPFCLALKNDKIERLGIHMKSFKEGVEEAKKQIDLSS